MSKAPVSYAPPRAPFAATVLAAALVALPALPRPAIEAPVAVQIFGPDSLSVAAGDSGEVSFEIQNVGSSDLDVTFDCFRSGPVVCRAPRPGSAFLPANVVGSASVTVPFNTTQPGGPGTLTLVVTEQGTGVQTSKVVAIDVRGVGVTVVATDGSTGPDREAFTPGHTTRFTVANVGSVPDTFTVDCGASPTVTCRFSTISVSLEAGVDTILTVPFDVGDSDPAAYVEVAAVGTGGNASARVTFSVSAPSFTFDIALAGPSPVVEPAGHLRRRAEFLLRSRTTGMRTITLECVAGGRVTTCAPEQDSVPLSGSSRDPVPVYVVFATDTANGAGTVTLRASEGGPWQSVVLDVQVEVYALGLHTPVAPTERIVRSDLYVDTFRVENTGTTGLTVTIECQTAAPVLTLVACPTVSNPLAVGATVDLPVRSRADAAGAGWVRVRAIAEHGASDEARIDFPVETYGAVVTALSGTPSHYAETGDYTYRFRVRNAGSTQNTFQLSADCPGLTCSDPGTVILAPGVDSVVVSTYATRTAVGVRDFVLEARGLGGGGTRDSAVGHVQVEPVDFEVVLPVLQSHPDTVVIGTMQHAVDFDVGVTGSTERLLNLSCRTTGPIHSCRADSTEVSPPPGADDRLISVTFNADTVDTGPATLTLVAQRDGVERRATWTVEVARYGVVVTRADTLPAEIPLGAGLDTAFFAVENTGSVADWMRFSCAQAGNLTVTCPADLRLDAAGSDSVWAADGFGSPHGTHLSSHTPDVGTAWVEATTGDFSVEVFGTSHTLANQRRDVWARMTDTLPDGHFTISTDVWRGGLGNSGQWGVLWLFAPPAGLVEEGVHVGYGVLGGNGNATFGVSRRDAAGTLVYSHVVDSNFALPAQSGMRIGADVRGRELALWTEPHGGGPRTDYGIVTLDVDPRGPDRRHVGIGAGWHNASRTFFSRFRVVGLPVTGAVVPVAFTVDGAHPTSFVRLTARGGHGAADSAQYDFDVPLPVTITVDRDSVSRQRLTGPYPAVFTVVNSADTARTLVFTCTSDGQVSCRDSSLGSHHLPASGRVGISVWYHVLAAGSGTVAVTATLAGGTGAAAGSLTVHSGDLAVAVTPVDGTLPSQVAGDSATAEFTVANTGTLPTTYAFTCEDAGNVFCAAPPDPLALDSGATATVPVAYTAGAAIDTGSVIAVTATSTDYDLASARGQYTFPVVDVIVAVTPDAKRVGILRGHTRRQVFTVRNGSAESQEVDLAITCGGVATGCATFQHVTIPPRTDGTLAVDVTVTDTTLGAEGTIDVVATASGGAVLDSGSVTLVIGDAVAPVVSVDDANPGVTTPRGACLTVAAGPGAAVSCGDLRVAHALPPITTLNKLRQPTLLYNSRHAQPHVVVAAHVRLPDGGVTPDSVFGVLTVDGVQHRAQWDGAAWSPGRANRVAMAFTPDSLAQGNHPYTLAVQWFAGDVGYEHTVDRRFPLLRRRAATDLLGLDGWWVAGVERLVLADTVGDTLQWYGGDGSTREYVRVSDSAWAAQSLLRPDTIKLRPELLPPGSVFDPGQFPSLPPSPFPIVMARLGVNGVEVSFDLIGRHVRTKNRLGHATRFRYYGNTWRLATIDVPTPDADPLEAYLFAYGTDGILDSVVAVPVDGQARTVGLTRDSLDPRRVTAITDPDSFAVRFAYDLGDRRITSRTDKRGTSTTYAYGSGQTVTEVRTDMGPGQIDIVTKLRPILSQGLAAAVDTADAYVLLDGPRTELGDTTRFWVNRFGQPRRIVDALGHETRVRRDDSRFPLLATKTIAPNGLVVTATYDPRGNLATQTDSSTGATTHYQWDQRWDQVTEIVAPAGDLVRMAYDPINGNRLWQQDGRGDSTRVQFRYTVSGLLRAVDPPLTAPDSLVYDLRGNLHQRVSALGHVTTTHRDAIGRDTLLLTPVDEDGTAIVSTRTRYDIIGRVRENHTISPSVNAVPSDTVTVENLYDTAGNLERVRRSSAPDLGRVGIVTTHWRYDRAGRPIAEIAPDGEIDSTVYDPAGNVVETRTRRDHRIAFEYDVLGRLFKRSIPQVRYKSSSYGFPTNAAGLVPQAENPPYPMFPNDSLGGYTLVADSATFAYDNMGNMLRADNAHAKVRRTYDQGGRLETDSLWIRTVDGSSLDRHVYGIRHRYDVAGRRVGTIHPSQLAPVVAGVRFDSTGWGYHPESGQLATVTDPLGNRVVYDDDVQGRLRFVARPGGIVDEYRYDDDGRLTSHLLPNGSVSPYRATGDTLRATASTYDARGKLLRSANRTGNEDWLTTRYRGRGSVLEGTVRSLGWDLVYDRVWTEHGERLHFDGLGRLLSSTVTQRWGVRPDGWGTPSDRWESKTTDQTFAYQRRVGRQVSIDRTRANDTLLYDAAGNLVMQTQSRFTANALLSDRVAYYDALNRLRVAETRSNPNDPITLSYFRVFEEYWYDALGRRVLVRARRFCEVGANRMSECRLSKVRRTVWDGDQELYEIQMPGDDPALLEADTVQVTIPVKSVEGEPWFDGTQAFGRVAYTHGRQLDRPLSVVRMGYSDHLDRQHVRRAYRTVAPFALFPIWTPERGQLYLGTFADGGLLQCEHETAEIERCIHVDWPGVWMAKDRGRLARVSFWHGSLLEDKRDASGTFYRRNRYYDPNTGQFTQEDPIGLAGGLNLYGFADGDPVNFSDPFGLRPCPPCDDETVWMVIGSMARFGSVMRTLIRHEETIENAATKHGVSSDLIRAVIFEEQSHLMPGEAVLERFGFGATVGLGQLTVGTFGSRSELLNAEVNINAIAGHLSGLHAGELIDPTQVTASVATSYNCGSCTQISAYGSRVARYARQFRNGLMDHLQANVGEGGVRVWR